MSVNAEVTLNVVSSSGSLAVLDALLASSWSARTDGWWCIPLDEESSEWSLLDSGGSQELRSLFQAKMSAHQIFGIRLWWEGSDVGGEFLFFASGEIAFVPSLNRMKINDRATDVSWYMARLLPVIERASGTILESWVWRESS